MSQPSLEKTKISFISMYRGEAHYRVDSGPMQGSRVSVRGRMPQFYRDEFRLGGPFNLTEEAWEQNYVGSVGIVNNYGRPVTLAVLAAVDADYNENRVSAPEDYCGRFCTGEWGENGWRRQEYDWEGASAVKSFDLEAPSAKAEPVRDRMTA